MRTTTVALALLAAALGGCGRSNETATTATAGGSTTAGSGGLGSDGGLGSSGLGGFGGAGSGSVAPGTQADLEVNVGDRVYFGYDSATLDQAARQTLDRQAQWLRQFSNVPVVVEGHTDDRGTREYNLALGERRAAEARNYLAASGVPASQITVTSYGEERQADPGGDERAYGLNRRAVTVVNATQ